MRDRVFRRIGKVWFCPPRDIGDDSILDIEESPLFGACLGVTQQLCGCSRLGPNRFRRPNSEDHPERAPLPTTEPQALTFSLQTLLVHKVHLCIRKARDYSVISGRLPSAPSPLLRQHAGLFTIKCVAFVRPTGHDSKRIWISAGTRHTEVPFCGRRSPRVCAPSRATREPRRRSQWAHQSSPP